ncbi:MAG: tRNA lysidine(34) synthetase TilS [Proteobacteria bacterium]|nr:tRNA lysidine(34) synthetase TilS [Pseudomonadota bacterium]
MSLTATVESLLSAHLAPQAKCAVAFSGGGDSLALLHAAIAARGTERVLALHFNHGLREASNAEADWVSDTCARIGVTCLVGTWQPPAIRNNIQSQARRARYAFLLGQMKLAGIQHLLLGHTRDDVAETLLERLGRGSGVRGLAVLPAETQVGGYTFLRPLRAQSRDALRQWLKARGYSWLEDPSNANRAFKRVRLRELMQQNADVLNAEALASTVDALIDADNLLNTQAHNWIASHAREVIPGVFVCGHTLEQLPDEHLLRVFSGLSQRLSPMADIPRGSKVLQALKNMRTRHHVRLGALDVWHTAVGFVLASTAYGHADFFTIKNAGKSLHTNQIQFGRDLPAKLRQSIFKRSFFPLTIRNHMPFWCDDEGRIAAAFAGEGLTLPGQTTQLLAEWSPDPVHFLALQSVRD